MKEYQDLTVKIQETRDQLKQELIKALSRHGK